MRKNSAKVHKKKLQILRKRFSRFVETLVLNSNMHTGDMYEMGRGGGIQENPDI